MVKKLTANRGLQNCLKTKAKDTSVFLDYHHKYTVPPFLMCQKTQISYFKGDHKSSPKGMRWICVQTFLHFSLRRKDPLAAAIINVGEEEERIPSS